MEGQEESSGAHAMDCRERAGEPGEGDQEVEEMVVDEGMEDWNGFMSGGGAQGEEEEGEVVEEWRPGDPVTPQQVLRLKTYTRGEFNEQRL